MPSFGGLRPQRRQRGRTLAGPQRSRPEAADADVAVDQFLVAEAIDQIDAEHVRRVGKRLADQRIEAVGGQEEVLRERIGRAIAMSRPAFLFDRHFRRHRNAGRGVPTLHGKLAFGKQRVGRQPRDRLQTVISSCDVQQNDRTGGHGMVGRRRGHHASRAGDGASFPDADRIERVVAVEDSTALPSGDTVHNC